MKTVPEPVRGTLTRDFETATEDKLQESPWQTDAYIGAWHYERSIFENHTYQKASTFLPMFVDIGSVELLGAKGGVRWTTEAGGLRVSVAHYPPCRHAYCFKILPA